MSERPENLRAEFKLRMPASLRARLEREADRYGYSLNTEIVGRLEESIRDDDLGRVVFGSEEQFGLLMAIDKLILGVKMTTGKDMSDRDTRYLMADTVASFIKHGHEIVATLMAGRSPSPSAARTVADAHALSTIATMLHKHLERRTSEDETEAAATPAGEAAE